MKILVVGPGGREHALAWHFSRTGHEVIVAPGNAGIARQFRTTPLLSPGIAAIVDVARTEQVELVVVGPEQPLVDGLVDALAAAGVPAFGPNAAAARLEGSKAFMKEVCRAAGVRSADFVVVRTMSDAEPFLVAREQAGHGAVVKADGLCAGKGVVVCAHARDARPALQEMLAGKFGDASRTVVIEDLLGGDEVSLFALCDGDDAVMFPGARDHKRLRDADLGPNTGGMGAVAPLHDELPNGASLRRITREQIVLPVLREMKKRGAPFRGVLFVGLMVHGDTPSVLEFNVRFGDPETEALLMTLPIDLAPALLAIARGERLPAGLSLDADGKSAVVVVAAAGYPDTPEKGAPIGGLDAANAVPDARVFCAGVGDANGQLVASGGRVLVVGGRGATFNAALGAAYAAVDQITMPGAQVRRDIGRSVREKE